MTLVSAFTRRDMDPERSQAPWRRTASRLSRSTARVSGAQLGQQAASTPEAQPVRGGRPRQLDASRDPARLRSTASSGYRIDFAAKHPTQPGRMVLAIECDGATYHSSATARDRDRLRQEHLERLGWRFHRIWSQDWFSDKQSEIDRAKRAYETAVHHRR